MKAQNSPPTSLAMINSKQPVNVTSGFDSNDLSQLFIELLDKSNSLFRLFFNFIFL